MERGSSDTLADRERQFDVHRLRRVDLSCKRPRDALVDGGQPARGCLLLPPPKAEVS
jgi:hypothetical protein